MRQLEIGPGDCPLAKWDTLDAIDVPDWWDVPIDMNVDGYRYFKARWGYETLPIPDGFYDIVYASHVIEHIPWYQTIDALKEVYRILRSEGRFECWTVDFSVVVQSYLQGKLVDDWDCGGKIKTFMQSIAGRIFSYEKHGDGLNWHKAVFDRPYLKDCMFRAGFTITGDLSVTRGHDHGPINMGVWAKK